jgi:hypothetical protein
VQQQQSIPNYLPTQLEQHIRAKTVGDHFLLDADREANKAILRDGVRSMLTKVDFIATITNPTLLEWSKLLRYPGSARWTRWQGGLRQKFFWHHAEYVAALRTHFLLPIVSNYPGKLMCACTDRANDVGVDLLQEPFHCLDCPKYCELPNTTRHHRVRDSLAFYLKRFAGPGGQVRIEPSLPAPHHARRADILYCTGARTQYIDVALCNPCAPKYLRGMEPGDDNPAMSMRKAEKESSYRDTIPAEAFIPFILAATGEVEESALRWMHEAVHGKKNKKHFQKTYCYHEINFHCAQQNARARVEAAKRAFRE